MEHELLHNETDFNLKLTNKTKKEKDKVDQGGEKKKWNFRKTNTSGETISKRSPSPSSGLINTSSELRSKKDASPQMIFENQITTDNDCESTDEQRLQSPPIPISSPSSSSTALQQTHTSPKSVSFDNQINNHKRLSQKTQSLSTSPPMLSRPSRKPIERIFRQSSAPASSPIHQSTKLNYQQQQITTNETFSTPFSNSQPETPDKPRLQSTSDIPSPVSHQSWQSVQQNLFPQTSAEQRTKEDVLHRTRLPSDHETPGGEVLNDNTNTMMWQQEHKQQELIHGNWTNFSSISNEVFAPANNQAMWAGASRNVTVDGDENSKEATREDASHSSNSSNSSESGNEEETEESVWKINDEQRAYYLNQFRVLQPAGKGVVTGQKARDFFLKSGLSTDVLSRIWNLADLDSDGALNFEEFCIAMHIVVAVRHGLEVPTTLSPFLLPEHYERQPPPTTDSTPQKNETRDQLPVPESPKTWARFSPDPENAGQTASPEEETGKVQPAIQLQGQQQHPEKPMSDPNSADEATPKDHQPTRKTSLGIPRVRGSVKQKNLLDQPHWAILPPPSKFNKDAEDTGKSVPIGTIIPDDTPDKDDRLPPVFVKVETVDKTSPRESDSSSSEEETKDRPKSLTNENLESASSSPRLSQGSSHDSVGANQDSIDGARKANTAPVPPPRKKTGHSRSSSLDLQKLFNNKGGSNSFQPTLDSSFDKSKKHKSLTEENLTNGTENKDATEQPRQSQENFADFSKFENSVTIVHQSTENNISRHRRSASLDSNHAIWVDGSPPKQQNNWEQDPEPTSQPQVIPASLPRPVPKKKPASPPPPLRQKKELQQETGSDGLTDKERKPNKEPIHFVVKPLTRLEQLHARIRDLKAKNTILSRVNNELQQEFKEMMEKRIELESQIEQHKPLSNG